MTKTVTKLILFLPLSMIFIWGCKPAHHENIIELVWHEEEGYRWAELHIDPNGETGFSKIPSSYSGVTINNYLPEELMDANRVLMNGSGVAAGDINGNGLVDLYFARIDGSNKLYENLGGFRFRDVTDEAGVALEEHRSTGVVFADVNGNGHLDLLVTAVKGENVLYLNDGEGNFTKQEESGLGEAKGSMTMALADVNGNNFPDLYVVNYREINVIDVFPVQDLTWENTIRNDELIPPYDDYFTIIDRGEGFPPERHEIARKDELYLNNGDGTFTLADEMETFRDENGNPLGLFPDWGLAAKFHDLNGNGLQDLYVNNDFWTPDRIWINQGDGTFRALDSLAIRNTSYYSMTVDFADISKNGYPDIFTVEMLDDVHSNRLMKRLPIEPMPLLPGEYCHRPRYNRNSLFLNRGDNTYAEISYYSGLHASEWSWATRFIDLNLNGHEDVIVVNGFAYDFQNLDSQRQLLDELIRTGGEARGYIEDFTPLRQQNRIYRNNGDLTFTDVSTELGFTDLDISLGLALADLNGNGVLDVIVSRMNDEASIYKNNTGGARIAVRLKGEAPNTQAIGAKIELLGGPVQVQSKQVISGGDYLSGSDTKIVFAADADHEDHELLITWPDGSQNRLQGLPPNRVYEIDQSAIKGLPGFIVQTPASESAEKVSISENLADLNTTMFEDISDRLNHLHHEDPYNDFSIQPLLPWKLSQQGPGIALVDLTGDGTDEWIIGSGKGGATTAFSFNGNSEQVSTLQNLLNLPADGDHTGMVAWTSDNTTHLVVGNANYEIGSIRAPSAFHIQVENGVVARVDSLPGTMSTTGPIAAADYTGNGQVDLFVGGRFVPGQYPADASSRLFVYDGERFVLDEENSEVLRDVGLVTSAVFVDYNRSGEQDLIVTTEWGTVKLFENNGGRFTERTEELGLDEYKGLWQGVAVGDFNNNGYPDLAVTNWGENNSYQHYSKENPMHIYYGDFNRNRRMDVIVSYFDENVGGYVPKNKWTQYEAIDDLLWHVQSHEQFANYTVSDMLNTDESTVPHKQINTLSHMVFLNNEGGGFEGIALPPKAQFSAGFYIGVADLDNNGIEDLFLTQNFFAVANPQSTPRLDAGRGLWLKGNGDGTFNPVPGHQSGVMVYGEQRGSALGDLNNNGKTDLIVSQNAAKTKLFLNRTEKRGIRVGLEGPASNLTGIGAAIRLLYENGRTGPYRYITAGGGYWSQNSTTQVLGYSEDPNGIEVRWADGNIQIEEFDTQILNYTIKYAKD